MSIEVVNRRVGMLVRLSSTVSATSLLAQRSIFGELPIGHTTFHPM